MWTFGCVNCQNVIPSLREWHKNYKDKGLVVIGNHYPEFSYEADLELVKQAMAKLDVLYPVAQDNEGVTWDAYHNRYWPTLYLIDKNGDLRYSHIGEGAYEETEAAIVALLNETYP
jgi:thiol-disulfide isomerase/thioredoxin